MTDVMAVDDDSAFDRSFDRWVVRWCVARLRRRLRAGLLISPRGWATLQRYDPAFARGGAMIVRFIERSDATGQRWARALDLLLDAGRGAPA